MYKWGRLFVALTFALHLALVGALADSFVYVSNTAINSISIIDTNTNQWVSNIALSSTPIGIAATPDGKKAYINTGSGISVLRLRDQVITATLTLPVGASLKEIAISANSQRAYFTDAGRNGVVVLDTSSDSIIATIPVDAAPEAIALNPNPLSSAVPYAYVTHPVLNKISTINLATGTVVNSIPVNSGPRGIAVTPDGSKAYVTHTALNSVSVVNLLTGVVLTTLAVGTAPQGIAITPDGRWALVANSGSNSVSVINLANQAVASTLPVGLSPQRVSAAPSGFKAYVSNAGSGTVSVINPRSTPTPSVLTTVNVGGTPQVLSGNIPDWYTYGNALERINYNDNESTINSTTVSIQI